MIIELNPIFIIIILAAILAYVYYQIRIKQSNNYIGYAFGIVFSIYILGLLHYTIFPIYINSSMAEVIHEEQTTLQNIMSNIKLVPFVKDFSPRDFILNIVMTIPMGILAPCLLKNSSTKKMLILGVSLGFFIELAQLLLGFVQGFTFRHINTEDVIANAIGVIIGYLIIKLVVRLYNACIKNRDNKFFKSLSAYLDDKFI